MKIQFIWFNNIKIEISNDIICDYIHHRVDGQILHFN